MEEAKFVQLIVEGASLLALDSAGDVWTWVAREKIEDGYWLLFPRRREVQVQEEPKEKV